MKKEKVKENKNLFLMIGVAASVVMIIIVLFFSISSLNKKAEITESSITGNLINLDETWFFSEFYTKQEVEDLLEKKCQEIVSDKIRLNSLVIDELSGEGSVYACIDSFGEVFRSQTPCK